MAAFTLSANQGSYVFTKEVVSLSFFRPSNVGSYAQTGKTQVLFKGHRLTAVHGSYSLTGESLGSSHTLSHRVFPTQGTYTFLGNVQSLQLSKLASSGSISLTGEPQNLTIHEVSILSASQGTYALTGKPQSASYNFPVPKGTYALAGKPQVLGTHNVLSISASSGTYTLSGKPQVTNAHRIFKPIPGSYSLAGKATTLTYFNFLVSNTLTAALGVYSFFGLQQDLLFSGGNNAFTLPSDSGNYTSIGQAADHINSIRKSIVSKIRDSWTLWSSRNVNGRKHRIKSGLSGKFSK